MAKIKTRKQKEHTQERREQSRSLYAYSAGKSSGKKLSVPSISEKKLGNFDRRLILKDLLRTIITSIVIFVVFLLSGKRILFNGSFALPLFTVAKLLI